MEFSFKHYNRKFKLNCNLDIGKRFQTRWTAADVLNSQYCVVKIIRRKTTVMNMIIQYERGSKTSSVVPKQVFWTVQIFSRRKHVIGNGFNRRREQVFKLLERFTKWLQLEVAGLLSVLCMRWRGAWPPPCPPHEYITLAGYPACGAPTTAANPATTRLPTRAANSLQTPRPLTEFR